MQPKKLSVLLGLLLVSGAHAVEFGEEQFFFEPSIARIKAGLSVPAKA